MKQSLPHFVSTLYALRIETIIFLILSLCERITLRWDILNLLRNIEARLLLPEVSINDEQYQITDPVQKKAAEELKNLKMY